MKKIYQCQYCHQYHPLLHKLEKQPFKNSKQAIRFSDLSISRQIISQNEQIKRGESWEQLQMMIPKAHPQNMTISGRKFTHNWNRNKKSKEHEINSDTQQIVDIQLNRNALSKLKRLKTDHQSKYSENKLKYCISHQKTKQNDKKEFSTDIKSRIFDNKQGQKSVHSKSSRKTHYHSISLHKNSGKAMKKDQIQEEINYFSLSGVSESQIISQVHKSALIEKLQESKFVIESVHKGQAPKKNADYSHSMSEYSFSGDKKKKLDYAGELATLKKVLQENSHKKQYPKASRLGENCIRIGEKYYLVTSHKRQECAMYTNSCLGMKICEQEGETSIIELPELQIYIISMSEAKPKKISNRFDEWEILSVFTEATDEFLHDKYNKIHSKFYIKSVLGILLAINAYMSHWGPWPWPQNYNLICFSIIFYYVASTIYSHLNDIDQSTGNKVGEYMVDGNKILYLFKLTPDRLEYILEEVDSDSKEVKTKKSFNYLQYFTKDGVFLESLFLKHLEGTLKSSRK